MIKENQKLLNRINVLTDAAAAVLAVTAAYLLVFNLLDFERNFPLTDYVRLALIFIPIQLVTYACMGLYGSFRSKTFATEFGRIFAAFLLDGMTLIALLYVVRIIDFSRWALAIFLALDFLIVTLKRFVLRKTLRKFRESGYNKKYVLIVGSGQAATDYLHTIREQRWLGYECAGCVADEPLAGTKLLGGMDSLQKVLEERSYDEVVCALGSSESEQLSAAVEACELTGTKISVIPSIYKYMSSSPAIDVVGNIPMMNIRRIPLDNIGNAALKRMVDIVGSLVLLVLTSPIMLASMLIIRITMGKHVIFRQQRVGLNKKIFTMYKLRSMRDSAEKDTAWSTENDPRRTKFGAFIRKFSIDELPQLVNVLKGDMSLVGPRPEIPFYVNDFKDKIPMYMIKHQVKPGMTGLAQINGYRGDTSIEKRIEFDVQYIENWNFFLDISILLRTALSGFMNKEKISEKQKKKKTYRPEKYNMNKNKAKIDLMALIMFLPSIIALAVIPVVLRITTVVTDLKQTYMYNGGSVVTGDEGTTYQLIDVYSQGKGLLTMVLAIVMIFMALVCCLSLFRRIEKRSLVYVGCSFVIVVMSLISAAMSDYTQIAFFGEYDRAEGFWTIACYFVMFLFSMYAFRTSGNFRFLMYGLFFCVGVNFILGVTQVTGHNLLQQQWFMNLIADSDLRGAISGTSFYTAQQLANGSLYHSNYMGSFTGLVVPLLTVMAMYAETKLQRVLYIVFDAMSIFLLVGSAARSGVVAVAAALIVGIIVFARQIAKHWKPCVILVASAAVVFVGANFALGNKLFERIPSLFEDAVGLIVPAAEEDRDLFSKLPLREISTPADGTLVLTGQNDTMTVGYDKETYNYTFTGSDGEPITDMQSYTFNEYPELKIVYKPAEMRADISMGDLAMTYTVDENGNMSSVSGETLKYSSDGMYGLKTDEGLVVADINGKTLYIEYDSEYKNLAFTEYNDGDEYGTNISGVLTYLFPDTDFSDVALRTEASSDTSSIRDVIAMYFYGNSQSSLMFDLVNGKKIEMIDYRTTDPIIPENAEHIGFEGKEKVGSSRGYIWSRTLPLLKNCLIKGYGADTFTYEFPQNDVLAKYYAYSDYNEGFYITVDKPHNMYLQMFYSNGLIALAAFLGIAVFYLVDCFRLYALRKTYRREQIMGTAVMLGIVGYLAAGIFNDSVVSVAPMFWVLLGTGAALNTINRRMDRNVQLDEEYAPVEEERMPTPEENEKDRQVAKAGEILAAAMRAELDKKAEEKADRTITRDDVNSLLESVRALKSEGSTDEENTEKTPEDSDDNG